MQTPVTHRVPAAQALWHSSREHTSPAQKRVSHAPQCPAQISLEFGLPPDFPERYRAPLLRAAEGCKVKRTIAAQPTIEVSTALASPPAATTATPPQATVRCDRGAARDGATGLATRR